ncbi:MAG: hypothetical protein CL933_26740 [Deltaproteobacteria bacterium]|nr:hypothetical protein [Deltaproteobacteria bacterium]
MDSSSSPFFSPIELRIRIDSGPESIVASNRPDCSKAELVRFGRALTHTPPPRIRFASDGRPTRHA